MSFITLIHWSLGTKKFRFISQALGNDLPSKAEQSILAVEQHIRKFFPNIVLPALNCNDDGVAVMALNKWRASLQDCKNLFLKHLQLH